jgi:hypothetical protein
MFHTWTFHIKIKNFFEFESMLESKHCFFQNLSEYAMMLLIVKLTFDIKLIQNVNLILVCHEIESEFELIFCQFCF